MFLASSGATIATAGCAGGMTVVATPVGGAIAGVATGIATSGAVNKYSTKLLAKYPCTKELAKQQAALDGLKAEMLQEMQRMLDAQLDTAASRNVKVEEDESGD